MLSKSVLRSHRQHCPHRPHQALPQVQAPPLNSLRHHPHPPQRTPCSIRALCNQPLSKAIRHRWAPAKHSAVRRLCKQLPGACHEQAVALICVLPHMCQDSACRVPEVAYPSSKSFRPSSISCSSFSSAASKRCCASGVGVPFCAVCLLHSASAAASSFSAARLASKCPA